MRKPYHPANLRLQPFAPWRVVLLAWVGWALGVQFKVDGIPYGAAYNPAIWPAEDAVTNPGGGGGGG